MLGPNVNRLNPPHGGVTPVRPLEGDHELRDNLAFNFTNVIQTGLPAGHDRGDTCGDGVLVEREIFRFLSQTAVAIDKRRDIVFGGTAKHAGMLPNWGLKPRDLASGRRRCLVNGMSLFEVIGGEDALRPLIDDFVQTMVADVMIGFFFNGVDVERLTELEYQFTARFMGAEQKYEGRPLIKAHARRPTFGGHFDRRRQLLLEAMDRHGVADEVKTPWLAHVDSLRANVTRDAKGPDGKPIEPVSPFRIVS